MAKEIGTVVAFGSRGWELTAKEQEKPYQVMRVFWILMWMLTSPVYAFARIQLLHTEDLWTALHGIASSPPKLGNFQIIHSTFQFKKDSLRPREGKGPAQGHTASWGRRKSWDPAPSQSVHLLYPQRYEKREGRWKEGVKWKRESPPPTPFHMAAH